MLIDRSSSAARLPTRLQSATNCRLVPGRRAGAASGRVRAAAELHAADGTTEQVGVERVVQAICPLPVARRSSPTASRAAAWRCNSFDVERAALRVVPSRRVLPRRRNPGCPMPGWLHHRGPGRQEPGRVRLPVRDLRQCRSRWCHHGCKPCNSHMDCTRTGLTLATVPLLPSRWRLSNRTASVYECTSSACLGGDWNGTSDAYCAQGYEGPRCEWCSDPDQYYDDASATCKDCGDMVATPFARSSSSSPSPSLSAFCVRPCSVRRACSSAPLAGWPRRPSPCSSLGLQAKFKCCLTFYQVWAVRKSVYGFELPGDLGGVMAFFDALSFDVGSFIFPSWTCLGGLTARLVFSGLWPLGLMAAVALCLLGLEAARKGSLQRALLRSLEAAIFISFCVLPSVTRSLFLAFKCESFGYDDLASPPESRPYLSASLNVECYSPEHAADLHHGVGLHRDVAAGAPASVRSAPLPLPPRHPQPSAQHALPRHPFPLVRLRRPLLLV